MRVFRQHFNKLVIKGIIQTFPFGNFKIIEEADSALSTLFRGEIPLCYT